MEQDRAQIEPNEEKNLSFGQRWDKMRPSKMVVFWSWIAVAIITTTVGFKSGGWVTGAASQRLADEAVVRRLSPICVSQFERHPERSQKLQELKATDSWKRRDFVEQQGWATMPGEEKPDRNVAEECVKLLGKISQ